MIKEEMFHGIPMYFLSFGELKLWVSPEDGMTIYQLEYGVRVIVSYNEERHKLNMTHGIPILYPTPNRTRNMSYEFNGFTHVVKNHGFAKEQSFEVIDSGETIDRVFIKGRFVITNVHEIYKVFPYESELIIGIEVREDSLQYVYEVHNNDTKPLPYGFGIHPFFEKNNEEVRVLVKADKVMDMTEDKLPTGKLIDVSHSEKDLRDGSNISTLSLDHVYTELEYAPTAIICYNDLKIELDSTKDFSHMVVFTPDASFFCIENQTCSTDAVNLYNKGFVQESGLNIVNTKDMATGKIIISFHEL
jgi:aldose 1-epimerase